MKNLKILKMLKRYEYLASENGKPIKKWTDWFEWNSDICPRFQLERHPKLLNEYKETPNEMK